MWTEFNTEKVAECMDEIDKLGQLHYDEVAFYKDIPFQPRWDAYLKICEADKCRLYTVRNVEKELLGYACFFIDGHMHYADSKTAIQDVLFLHPAIRGQKTGAAFISWCDEQLKSEDVQVVIHHVKVTKPQLDFSPLLEKMGYMLMDKIYTKRLDKE